MNFQRCTHVTFTSLAFNSVGRPCIGFADTWDVRLACWNGSTWLIEGIGTNRQDIYVSLAFDSLGRSHLVYFERWSGELWYKYKDASGWHEEKVDSIQGTGYHSLAVDAQGNPHIAYCTGNDVKYAHKDAAGWHTESIGASGQTAYPSLALDRSGYPRISYQQSNYGDLMYAFKDVAGWHHEAVDIEGYTTGDYNFLALDAQGNPHISYRRSCDLKYARRNGTSWTVELVHGTTSGSCMYTQNNTSLKLDSGGWPHISYYQPPDGALWYARKNDSGWHTELVASENVGRGNSLAFDPLGKPYISYVDSSGDKPTVNLAMRLDAPQPPPTLTPTPTATPTPTPKPVGRARSESPELAAVASGGVVAVWEDDRFSGGYPSFVFAHRFGQDGNPMWPADVLVSSAGLSSGSYEPSIAVDGEDNSFVVWSGSQGVFAGKLDSNGNRIWESDVRIYDRSNASRPRVALDSYGNWYVGWRTYAGSCEVWPRGTTGPCSIIRAAKPGAWNGPVSDFIYAGAYWPDMAVDRDGNVHLVWEQGYGENEPNVFGMTLSSAGDRRWPNPVRINNDPGTAPQDYPCVAVDAVGNSFIAWADMRNGNWDIYAQKFDVNMGHRLWENDVRVNNDATMTDQIEPDLIVGTDGYVYVVWADGRSGRADIYAQKLTLDGAKVWPQDLRISAAGPTATRSKPVIALDTLGFLYIAWESQDDIYMQSYTISGDRCWSVDVAVEGIYSQPAVICTPPPTPTPTLTATPSTPWLTWREPSRPLLVPLRGATVIVDYGNIPAPAVLSATLTGPAVFADGSQTLTVNITAANGDRALRLKPATGAAHGATFTLEVTLAGLRLAQTGVIVAEHYLPLVLKH